MHLRSHILFQTKKPVPQVHLAPQVSKNPLLLFPFKTMQIRFFCTKIISGYHGLFFDYLFTDTWTSETIKASILNPIFGELKDYSSTKATNKFQTLFSVHKWVVLLLLLLLLELCLADSFQNFLELPLYAKAFLIFYSFCFLDWF